MERYIELWELLTLGDYAILAATWFVGLALKEESWGEVRTTFTLAVLVVGGLAWSHGDWFANSAILRGFWEWYVAISAYLRG